MVAVAVLLARSDGGGAEDHDRTEQAQSDGHQKEPAVGFHPTWHRYPLFDTLLAAAGAAWAAPSAWTYSLKSRPRCSKFWNWSKLAQAGASSTMSPGRACAKARATARPRVPARSIGKARGSPSAGESCAAIFSAA